MAAYPIAPKTQAAGVSAAVSGAALYILQTYVFKGNVPDGIASLVYVAVPGVLAFAAAYWAPHQVRAAPAASDAPFTTAPRLPPGARIVPPSSKLTDPPPYPPSVERLEAPPVAPQTAADEQVQPPGAGVPLPPVTITQDPEGTAPGM